MFNEYAREIIAKSPFKNTIAAAYANGCIAYIPVPELCGVSGVYEARQTGDRTFVKETGPEMNRVLRDMGEFLYKTGY